MSALDGRIVGQADIRDFKTYRVNGSFEDVSLQRASEIAAVKKGDEIITGGGIRGRVTKVSDDEAEVEIAQGVKIRVVKSTITAVLNPTTKPAND